MSMTDKQLSEMSHKELDDELMREPSGPFPSSPRRLAIEEEIHARANEWKATEMNVREYQHAFDIAETDERRKELTRAITVTAVEFTLAICEGNNPRECLPFVDVLVNFAVAAGMCEELGRAMTGHVEGALYY